MTDLKQNLYELLKEKYQDKIDDDYWLTDEDLLECASEVVESLSLPGVSDCCSWIYDNVEEKWNTDCDQSHFFNYWGLPIDHDHKFCPYCGKEIKSSCR